MNAFFSGSVKGFDDFPYWYPANIIQFLNGSIFQNPDCLAGKYFDLVISGVSGLFDEVKFQEKILKKHFGQELPLDFHGYNSKGNGFPFWSSEPFTYAVSLLALSQYYNIK